MEFVTSLALALVPVVIGLVTVGKKAGIKSRRLPLLAVVLGIGGNLLITGFTGFAVIGGIIIGLLSVGLFSGTRSTITG
jgi:hypothetical protein